MFRSHILPRLALFVYRLWSATWSIECIEPQTLREAKARSKPLIFAHWHGDELCIVPLVGPYKIATMTSTSRDGQLIDFAVRKLGGATSRGSSTRGGISALKGLIRLMRSGYRASMAVDGPKGPLHQVKPGIFELSRLGDAAIVPMGAACSRSWIFEKSWNKARLPKPFSKITVYFNEPWSPLTKADSARDPHLAERLANEISRACKAAEEHLR